MIVGQHCLIARPVSVSWGTSALHPASCSLSLSQFHEVLSGVSRVLILKTLGLSSKNILPNIKFDINWKSIIDENFDSESFKHFYETITSLENQNFSDDKFNYFSQFYGIDLTNEQFVAFKKEKYVLTDKDKKQSSHNLKYIVFYNRLKAIV